MITLLLVLITCYITKVYYTRDLKIHISGLDEHDLMTAMCARCSQYIVISRENMRNPFYCELCK